MNNMKKTTFSKLTLLAIVIMTVSLNVNGQFAAGNIVVEQIGDGSTTLGSGATTVKLIQFTPSGTAGTSTSNFGSTGTPANSPYNLVDSGSGTSEGYISLSTDKTFVVIPGYNAPSGTASVATTASATYGRTIGKVTSTGVLQTNGTFNTFTGGNFRSIASNGTSFWLGGSVGISYASTDATTGIATTATSIFSTNTRIVNTFNNTLFASTSSTAFNGTGSNIGIYQVGTFNSLPTSTITAGTAINIIGEGTASGPSPYGFVFNPNGLTCYVADDRASALGGIQKWTYSGSFSTSTGWSGGTWTLAYTLGTGATNVGARGLTVDFSGTNPILYGTSAETSLNRFFKIIDSGSSSTATTLATAAANYIFRGICFAPVVPPSISIVEASIPILSTEVTSRIINVSGLNLTGDITLAISGTNATQFDVTPKTLTQTAGTVASTPVTISYTNNGSADAAVLTLSSPGATSKTFNLAGGITTGISQVLSPLSVSASDGVIRFTAESGRTIELYNAVGQKLLIKQTMAGLNSIQISAKGIIMLKMGNKVAKVVL